MDRNAEYHDPDYPQASTSCTPDKQTLTEEQKILKIKSIVRREFAKELDAREEEMAILDQRMASARHLMHRLRYKVVSQYYEHEKLKMTSSQINSQIAAQTDPRAKANVASILREGQSAIPPSLKKLLGKKTIDLEEIFKHRGPRTKSRVNYVNMVRPKNVTIPTDSTTSLRPEGAEVKSLQEDNPCTSTSGSSSSSAAQLKKVPRQLMPKITNVFSLNEATRNQIKHRFRIIIGNTSKYAPAVSQNDRSSHVWLLYVRGAARVVARVTVTLHQSYQPHHRVTLLKPPFHVSRRGWGEFPAKVELHFAHPEYNRPLTVEHTIKLDRNYTGLQTLGAETVLDVWLYSDEEMIQHALKEDEEPPPLGPKTLDKVEIKQEIKEEIMDSIEPEMDSWLEFFNNETPMNVDDMLNTKPNLDYECLLESSIGDREDIAYPLEDTLIPNNVITPSSPKKKIMKYMDPTTGKVYYLEIDRNIDLSKVQEIVLNPDDNPKLIKISPMKNGCSNSCVKSIASRDKFSDYNNVTNSHIQNDHCYLGAVWSHTVNILNKETKTKGNELSSNAKVNYNEAYNSLLRNVERMQCVRSAVNYLLRSVKLVSKDAKCQDFVKVYPFVVASDDAFWKMDLAKRRNCEWSRAKFINKILNNHLRTDERIWRTKQILLFSRLHGYNPTPREHRNAEIDSENWSDTGNTRKYEHTIKEMYPNPNSISTLTIFDTNIPLGEVMSSDVIDISDDELNVTDLSPVKVKKELQKDAAVDLEALPVDEEEKLRFLFLERMCGEIGVELRNEDVGNGFCYSAVHAVLLSAMKQFAEEIIRSALGVQISDSSRSEELPNIPVWESSEARGPLSLSHVYRAVSLTRASLVTSRGLGATPVTAYKL